MGTSCESSCSPLGLSVGVLPEVVEEQGNLAVQGTGERKMETSETEVFVRTG